jgi:hypothetical protein
MITTGDRVRAAARAAADTVPPDSAPPLRLPAPPRRRRWRPGPGRLPQSLTPLAAAVGVIAVLAASLALTSSLTRHRAAPQERALTAAELGGVPRYYVALSGPADGARSAVVRATATGRVLATVTPPRPYGAFMFLSAAADGRTFVLAAQRWWRIAPGTRGLSAQTRDDATPVAFFLLRLRPGLGPPRLTALHLPGRLLSGRLSGIALSPDGRTLALSLRVAEIRLVSLAGGPARDWAWPGSAHSTQEWAGNAKPDGAPLSWTSNGQALAFQMWTKSGGITQVRLLDTGSAGGSLLTASRPVVTFAPVRPGGLKTGPLGNTLITPDGSKIVTVTQLAAESPGPVPAGRVAEFSVRTGRVARIAGTGRVVPWDVLWTSPSGRTLIVTGLAGAHSARSVLAILTGQQVTLLPGTPPETDNVAW